tara:strand:- start:866 stop:1234 length:369 start_codon:yes stop_codon:yes gene_type:complete
MKLIDFGSDFAELLIKHTGLRYRAGTKDDRGRMKEGVNSCFSFKGTYPQPVTQDDMVMLPEGTEVSSTLVIHSVQKLNVVGGKKKADTVTWEGVDYLVMQSDRRNHLGNYYRNVIKKVQAGE